MNDHTILTLIELNQKFYLNNATSFHKTRTYPWSGWSQVIRFLPNDLQLVIDVGCGNGRWFSYLSSQQIKPTRAIGIDIDGFMINTAKSKFTREDGFYFYQAGCIHDLQNTLDLVAKSRAQAITAFGLWHHVPSYELRLKNLRLLCDNIDASGVVCVSLWQFAGDPTYANKLIPPDRVVAQTGLDFVEFEPGDYFLGWQGNSEAIRYCHSFSDEEISRLAADIGLPYRIIAGVDNDRTNRYLVIGPSVGYDIPHAENN